MMLKASRHKSMQMIFTTPLIFLGNTFNWFAGSNWASFLSWTIFILVAALFVTILVTFIIYTKENETFRKRLDFEASSVRVFRIDTSRDLVTYFNLSEMANKKTSTISQFYESFPQKEQEKVKIWVQDNLNGKETPSFLQTEVYIRKYKKATASYLKVTNVNHIAGTLHLESYILQETKHSRSLISSHPFVTEKDYASAIKSNGANNGVTICYSLRRKKVDGYDNNVPRSVFFRFRSAIEQYLSGYTKLLKAGENEFIVGNFDINDFEDAFSYCLRTVNGVSNILLSKAKAKDPVYVIKAGIVMHKDLYGEFNEIVEAAKRAVNSAFESSLSIYQFKKGYDDLTNFDVTKFRTEVEKIIFDKRINNLFKPIYGFSRRSVYGYIAKAVPDSDKTSFATIEELKTYAIRANDQNNLFSYLAKTIVSRFVSERPLKSQKLIYPIMVTELSTIPSLFANLRGAKEANIIFLLDEKEMLSALKSLKADDLLSLVNEVHQAGFQLGVSFTGKTLSLDDAILRRMDAFFVDFLPKDVHERKMDMSIRSQLHALVEKLLKYKQPIIGTNLLDWSSIELVVGSGIDYVSSDEFGPYQDGFVPLKDKDELKLKEMRGKVL